MTLEKKNKHDNGASSKFYFNIQFVKKTARQETLFYEGIKYFITISAAEHFVKNCWYV